MLIFAVYIVIVGCNNSETFLWDMKNINLLSNEPCREDAFEGHAHKNIAEQVARIVSKDDKRRVIGIEGIWGSGKSNLISLVNKKLNGEEVYEENYEHKNSPFPFFVYDAWGHQSDFQRRAILEELTQDLTMQKKILDGKKWKNKLEELLAKRRKTTTKEVPRLGIALVVGTILCLLTPLVVFVIGLVPDTKWRLKIMLSVLPPLIGFIFVIIDRIISLKKHHQDCTLTNILSEAFWVYKDQIKENETYTTISEKEPSSAEFKAWMDEVDKDLKKAQKTLVIVFDNMDRLPSEKVQSLWSSIHSFFSDKTYERIKVLIPFDRRHVNKAFKGEDTDGASYGNDFINKTFDVVFRVPPPIMSGWQQYMTEKWKEAFGPDEELDISVTQIYDALNKNHTPRKIIAFINEVATVKMTLQDDIPDKYITLFIMGKEKIEEDPIGQLLNPTFMENVAFEYANDPDTIKYLSALYYQLPIERALDVVFTQEAAEALNTGNGERLHDMMEHIDLSTILSNAVLRVSNVEKATKALADLDAYYGYNNYGEMSDWLKKIWEDLYQKCKDLGVKWDEIKDYHPVLYAHLQKEELADFLVKGYLSIEDKKWEPKHYVETIDKLQVNNDIIDQKLKEYQREVAPGLFLELLRYTEDNYEDYGVSCDLGELDEYLAGLERKEVLSLNVIPHVKLTKDQKLESYQAKLEQWIGESSDLAADEVGGLFARLKEVANKPIDYKGYFSEVNLFRKWNEISNSNNLFKYDLLAMRIARRNDFNSTYRSVFQSHLGSDDEWDLKALSKVIEYYVSYGDLLLNSNYYKDFTLVSGVFRYLTTNKRGGSTANIKECLVHFDEAVSDYGIDPKILFERLNGWEQFVTAKDINVERLPSGLISVAQEDKKALSDKILDACDRHFNTPSQEQWKEHVLQRDDTYRIWKLYHPKKYQANFDALKMVLKEYASTTNTEQPDKELIDEWLAICMEVKHALKGLFNDVGTILKRDSMITKEKLLFFGPYILKYGDAEKQKDFVEKLVSTEILDADVVAFIAEHIDLLKSCELSDEFKAKIRHLAQTHLCGEEAVTIVCENMGIDIDVEKEN